MNLTAGWMTRVGVFSAVLVRATADQQLSLLFHSHATLLTTLEIIHQLKWKDYDINLTFRNSHDRSSYLVAW
jgi:hypothetical protein